MKANPTIGHGPVSREAGLRLLGGTPSEKSLNLEGAPEIFSAPAGEIHLARLSPFIDGYIPRLMEDRTGVSDTRCL
jgi:hypothetical protein